MKVFARPTRRHGRMRPSRQRVLMIAVAALAMAGDSACSDRQAVATPNPSASQPAARSAVQVATPSPAPLGLRFGMKPGEVPFPVIVAPGALGPAAPQPTAAVPAPSLPSDRSTPARARGTVPQPSSGPVNLFASGQPPAAVRTKPFPPAIEGTGTAPGPASASRPAAPLSTTTSTASAGILADWSRGYIDACETAFDRTSDLGAEAPEWLAWRAANLDAGEGKDFADVLVERAEATTYSASTQTRTVLDAERSAGLYRLDAADGRRAVCLLFTTEGLAHVFIAGDALSGIRDEIVARLEESSGLVPFTLIHEAARFSLSLSRPACGLYCRLFGERILVERQLWLDRTARILVATKRAVVASGLNGLFAGMGAERELPDLLPGSFVASTDLIRRAHVLRQMLGPSATPAAGTGSGVTSGFGAAVRSTKAASGAAAEMSRQAVVQSFIP